MMSLRALSRIGVRSLSTSKKPGDDMSALVRSSQKVVEKAKEIEKAVSEAVESKRIGQEMEFRKRMWKQVMDQGGIIHFQRLAPWA